MNRIEQLRMSGQLPSPKGVALSIMQISQREDATLDEVTRLVQTDPALSLGETEHAHLREIANGGHHLLELINELLDLARIESRGGLDMQITPHPLADMVQGCIQGLPYLILM